jgi:hypothetical protein
VAVVINDFEILADPAPPPADQQSPPPAPAPPPTPRDLERVLDRYCARAERVRAH